MAQPVSPDAIFERLWQAIFQALGRRDIRICQRIRQADRVADRDPGARPIGQELRGRPSQERRVHLAELDAEPVRFEHLAKTAARVAAERFEEGSLHQRGA